MAGMFDKFKDIIRPKDVELELSDDYIELDKDGVTTNKTGKILIRLFTLNEYEDVKPILNAIREGHTISVINITPLKEKEMMSLKRAIDKLKKTVDANDGDIAGLAENLLIATPAFAHVHRGHKEETPKTEVIGYD